MLHGLTSTKETWNGIYQVIPFLTGRRVCIYDARNHGESSWNDTFTLDILAEDLGNFMRDRGIKKASLVGHSMGGMTVMRFALKNPDKVESIFIEDISAKLAPSEVGDGIKSTLSVWMNSLSAIPADADEETAKRAVVDYITKVTKNPPPESISKGSPLRFKDGVWQWKMNLAVLIESLVDIDSFFGKMEGQYNKRSFFIYGEASPFKVIEDKQLILKLFPKTEFFGVKGAGHSVHKHTAVYIRKLVQFLNRKVNQNNPLQ